jgi:hypothetical protein
LKVHAFVSAHGKFHLVSGYVTSLKHVTNGPSKRISGLAQLPGNDE